MELRQLEYFAVLAEELHFGRAAERLHIVQPAVSQQLRKLEAELGVALVDRSSRHVELTEAGRRFLPQARAVLAAVDRARESVAGAPAVMRLGTSSGLGDRLGRLLAELERRAPGTQVELVRVAAETRLRRVAAGTLDAALVRGATARPGVRLEPVWSDDLLAALPAGHPAADGEPLALSTLAGLPLRLPPRERNPALVDLVLGACAAAGFDPPRAPAPHDGDMLAAIAAGPPTWTVLHAARARTLAVPGVAFRAVAGAPLRMPVQLAIAPEPRRVVRELLAACRAVA